MLAARIVITSKHHRHRHHHYHHHHHHHRLLILILILAVIHIYAAALVGAAVLDSNQVRTWANTVSRNFADDVNETMRITDLQSWYDEASRTITTKKGLVEAAKAEAELALILSKEDAELDKLADIIRQNPLATTLDLSSTALDPRGTPYFARLSDGKLISGNAGSATTFGHTDAFNPVFTPWFADAVAGPKDVHIIADTDALHSLPYIRQLDYLATLSEILDTISPNDNIWLYKLDGAGNFETIDGTCAPEKSAATAYVRGSQQVIASLKTKSADLNDVRGSLSSAASVAAHAGGDAAAKAQTRWADALRQTFDNIKCYRQRCGSNNLSPGRDAHDIGAILLLTASTHGPRRHEFAFRKDADGDEYLDAPMLSSSNNNTAGVIRNDDNLPLFTFHFDADNTQSVLEYACDSLGSVAVVPTGTSLRNKGEQAPAQYFLHLTARPSPTISVRSNVQFFGGATMSHQDYDLTIQRAIFSRGTDPPALLGVLAVDYSENIFVDALNLINGQMGQKSFPVLTTPQGDTIYHQVIMKNRDRQTAGFSDRLPDIGRYEYFAGFDENIRKPFLDGVISNEVLQVHRSLPAGDASSEGFDGEDITTEYYYTPIGAWDLRLMLIFDEIDLSEEILDQDLPPNRLITSQVGDYLDTVRGANILSGLQLFNGQPAALTNDGNCPNEHGLIFANCKPDAYCARVVGGTQHPVGTVSGAPACVPESTCKCEIHRWPVGLTSRSMAVIHIAPISLNEGKQALDLKAHFAGGQNAEEKKSLTYNMTAFINRDKLSVNPVVQQMSDLALSAIPFCAAIGNKWTRDAEDKGTHNDTVWIYYGTSTGISTIYPSNNWGFTWDPTTRPWYHRARAAGSRTRTAILSTPYVDGGGAGLMNTLASPVWDRYDRLRGVVGLDFLCKFIGLLLWWLKEGIELVPPAPWLVPPAVSYPPIISCSLLTNALLHFLALFIHPVRRPHHERYPSGSVRLLSKKRSRYRLHVVGRGRVLARGALRFALDT
jgi:hypothetical protein